MRIPEYLFRFINPFVKTLLNSPFHGLLSRSVLVLYFQGHRSGRALNTPVRYVRTGDSLTVITSTQGRWWPNFVETQRVEVQLAGTRRAARACAYRAPDPMVRSSIPDMLTEHPADAVYLGIERGKGSAAIAGQWEAATFETAVAQAVALKITLTEDQRR